MACRSIAIYSHSLFAEGLGLLLEAQDNLEVFWLDSADPTALHSPAARQVDMLLFDLAYVPDTRLADLLCCCVDHPLLALDLCNDQLLLITGSKVEVSSVSDLLPIIERYRAAAGSPTGHQAETVVQSRHSR